MNHLPRALFILALSVGCALPQESSLEFSLDGDPSQATVAPLWPAEGPLVIQGDTRLKAGERYAPARGSAGSSPAILLEGLSGVSLDFRGLHLRGAARGAGSDAAFGLGVVLRNCEGVRVLGGELSGYRVGLLVENSRDIVIEGLEVSWGYASALGNPALTPADSERLELSDTDDTWFDDLGAGIFIRDSSRVRVEDCRVRASQNGLVAQRSHDCTFEDNDFSYLSGWGLALDGSEDNSLRGNRCDFIARCEDIAHGEESLHTAGFLILRGSSRNLFVGNSARHCSAAVLALGREGHELFANHFARNDFSWATWRGMHLEYTHDAFLVGNDLLGRSRGAVELEHCARVVVTEQRISGVFGAGLALRESEDCFLANNHLEDCDQALEIEGGSGHRVRAGVFVNNLQDLVLQSSTNLGLADNDFQLNAPALQLADLSGLAAPAASARAVWFELRDGEGQLPSGRANAVEFVLLAGAPAPDCIAARKWFDEASGPDARGPSASEVDLQFSNFTPWDPAAGPLPVARARRGDALAGATWKATWFAWGAGADPRADLERWRAQRFEALARGEVDGWSDPFGGDGELEQRLSGQPFGIVAKAQFHLAQAGSYALGTLCDDGLRILIDGQIVFEEWTWQAAHTALTTIELEAGRHEIAFEYFQIDGAASKRSRPAR